MTFPWSFTEFKATKVMANLYVYYSALLYVYLDEASSIKKAHWKKLTL